MKTIKRSIIGLFAVVAVALASACSPQQAAKDEAAAKAVLARADIVCVGLIRDQPGDVIAKVCGIEQPTAETIRDGLSAYEDVRAGVSAGPDISAAVDAAQQVIRAVNEPVPTDAGGQ